MAILHLQKNVVDRVDDILNIANVPYDPVKFAQYPNGVPLLSQNCRLIDVDAKYLTTLATSQCMTYVFCCTKNTTMFLLCCRRGLGCRTIAWIMRKHLITRISSSVNQITSVACARKRPVCTSHHTHNYLRNVWSISQPKLSQQSQTKRGMRMCKII